MSSNDKIYCGIGKCPKGSRYGTMPECVKKKQVRRYGVYKVDSRLINAKVDNANDEIKRKEVIMKMMTLRGKINNLTKNMVYERDPKKKKEMNNQLVKLKQDLKVVSIAFAKIENNRKK